MPLFQVIILLVVIGVILWAINTFIPMNGTIRTIINAIVVIAVIIYVLRVFGIWTYLTRLWI